MGVRTFEPWASRLVQSLPLSALKDSVIGIDATYYLERLLNPPKEPLLSALGGTPLALEAIISKDLAALQTAGIKPHFVFNGLECGVNPDPFKASIESSVQIVKAFEIYEKDMANEAITVFRTSGAPTPAALFDFLKKVLYEHKVEFTVAPYSALAQLVYYEKDPSQFIDAIFGPSELFLYGIDKIIIKLDLAFEPYEVSERGAQKKSSKFVLEDSHFSWVDRRTCLEKLGNIPPEVFIDACLTAGSTLLDTFPPLKNSALYSQGYSIPDAVQLLNASGRSVHAVCSHYQEDPLVKPPDVKSPDYLDLYKRAVAGIRHHVVVRKDGSVERVNDQHAPDDVHDILGIRIPEELNMYLFRGMIRPRLLNWLIKSRILILAPYDGGDSAEYRKLVQQQLRPWREQALSLLADSMTRYFHNTKITTQVWFDPSYNHTFTPKDVLPSMSFTLRFWRVRDDLLLEQKQKLEGLPKDAPCGSLYFAVRSILDEDFASKTITTTFPNDTVLKTTDEVVTNAIWRFLHLRGYVDKKHQLTAWGKFLETTLRAVGTRKEQGEAAFLAVELLRLDLLNPDTMFVHYSGAPQRGTETDRRNTMLVSRVACLGRLRHQPRGYSGPLSRHLLAYHCMITEVRACLRDLVEASLATMFTSGDVDRQRNDWMDISLSLPFYSDESCALGIVTKTYLDELIQREDPTSKQNRLEMRQKGQSWVGYADFEASLDDAFHLWDAVYEGVSTSNELIKDKKMWEEVDQWLSDRR